MPKIDGSTRRLITHMSVDHWKNDNAAPDSFKLKSIRVNSFGSGCRYHKQAETNVSFDLNWTLNKNLTHVMKIKYYYQLDNGYLIKKGSSC